MITNITNISLQNELYKNIKNDIDNGIITGAAALVHKDGKIAAELYLGSADSETSKPVCSDSIYRLASMTKPITATAVLICKERGLLSLYDKISTYIPGFRNICVGSKNSSGEIIESGSADDSIKIINLLTHSSGIVSGEIGFLQYDRIPPEKRTNLKDITDWYSENLLLDFYPDSLDSYSPIAAFDVAARIVEIVTGEAFEAFVTKNIFEPLGITDITFTPTEEQWDRTVKLHERKPDGSGHSVDRLGHKTFDNMTYFSGGVSLVGSAADYMKFAEMLFNGGKNKGERIISPESVSLMSTPYKIRHKNENWGLGVRVILNDRYLPAGSFGWSGAYGTHFWIDRTNNIIAIYMKNSYYDTGAEAKTARRFEQIVYENI